MYSGTWSIHILSNNGYEGVPIAYQRTFTLEVDPQVTVTVTPSSSKSMDPHRDPHLSLDGLTVFNLTCDD